MRFAFAVVTFLGAIASASAASLSLSKRQFPNCAEECLASANLDGCNPDDDTCLCNSTAFVDSVTSCIESSCTGSQLTEAEQDAQQLCLAVQVTLTAASGSPTSTSSGSSSTPTSATTTSSGSSASQTKSSGAISHGISALTGLAAVCAIAFTL